MEENRPLDFLFDYIRSQSQHHTISIESVEDEGDFRTDKVSVGNAPLPITPFEIPILGGATEQIFVSKIYPYLTASDLCSLSRCSKFFLYSTSAAKVWNNLMMRDFLIPEVTSESDTASINSIGRNSTSYLSSTFPTDLVIHNKAKIAYLKQFNYMQTRTRMKKLTNDSFDKTAKLDQQRSRFERILDIANIFLLIPLPFYTAFLSLLLISMKFDGYVISPWWCAFPVIVLFVYVLVCTIISMIVYYYQDRGNHPCSRLWNNMYSPLKTLFVDILHHASPYITLLVIAVYLLCFLQILLITMKLSYSSDSSMSQHLPWAVVFLPIWCLLSLYCIAPVLGLIEDASVFTVGAGMVWSPILVFTICLAVKLTREEQDGSRSHRMRLALIFIPFWVIEGAIMVGSLFVLLQGLVRYRRGYTIDDFLGIISKCNQTIEYS
jgi:hypothetical protein